jgi:hypothetical protein
MKRLHQLMHGLDESIAVGVPYINGAVLLAFEYDKDEVE